MKLRNIAPFGAEFGAGLALPAQFVVAAELPSGWIDPDTGHRVVRLSRDDGTASLCFNQNAYTKAGKKLILTTRGGGIATIDPATRELKRLVQGPVSVLVTGHKTGDFHYTKRGERGGIVYANSV
jgi:oligogalacturonide lyase